MESFWFHVFILELWRERESEFSIFHETMVRAKNESIKKRGKRKKKVKAYHQFQFSHKIT